ncbi:hypothetical protein F5144DRAFT_574162 [Chaetomium tenue]|uniref:Uncharacterized protein n=1 Tax=Chaetomium tenue TaxID=1854479 RepID=A0ACB7PBG7_9PEZI|nr:hypothetical protein F5144DRAFT_574162 [Chaetomium globosum]
MDNETLLDFELVVKALQGDGQARKRKGSEGDEVVSLIQGASWDLLDGYGFFLDSLEEAKKRVDQVPFMHRLNHIELGRM